MQHQVEMEFGDTAVFVPCISKRNSRSSEEQEELCSFLKENVTIICWRHKSGNAKVRDQKGLMFFCNAADLRKIE
jgi:hypothetical protein